MWPSRRASPSQLPGAKTHVVLNIRHTHVISYYSKINLTLSRINSIFVNEVVN